MELSLQWVIIILLSIIVYHQFDDIKYNLEMLCKPSVTENTSNEHKVVRELGTSDNVDIIEPTGVVVTNDTFEKYTKKDIPAIPYATHLDLIAPPKAAVEILCPECSNKWE